MKSHECVVVVIYNNGVWCLQEVYSVPRTQMTGISHLRTIHKIKDIQGKGYVWPGDWSIVYWSILGLFKAEKGAEVD